MAKHSLPDPQRQFEAEKDVPLASVVERNIAALTQRRQKEEDRVGWQERIADGITRFTGSMIFVYIHMLAFGFWTAVNSGLLPIIKPWDANFIILATVTSVEAIFLSTFILISQNRMAEADRKNAELEPQMTLLAEHEVSKSLTLVVAIAEHLGIDTDVSKRDLDELEQEVDPNRCLIKLRSLILITRSSGNKAARETFHAASRRLKLRHQRNLSLGK
jgi:uncharacterized membrane protein